MIDQALAAVQIFKELPDAVGYSTYGPIAFPLPEEISITSPASAGVSNNEVLLLGLNIYNQTSKVQENIRILFDGELELKPKLRLERRNIEPKFELFQDDKEIRIKSLPPNETLTISIFNPKDNFRIHQVLVGDKEVTQLMQKLAEIKKYPTLARLQLLTLLLAFAAVVGASVAGIAFWKRWQEDKIISEATRGLASCNPYVFENPPENAKLIERKVSQLGVYKHFVLFANKVESTEQLKQKDQVILCQPAES